MTGGGHVRGEHPFAAPPSERDPVRRLRGRVAAGVTIVTSGPMEARAGLTISSVLIAEGTPARILALVNEATDLRDALEDTGRFIVHVLEEGHAHLSEEYAGVRPHPGGVFSDRSVADTPWGPALLEVSTRAACTVERLEPIDGLMLLIGRIDRVELGELSDPLVYFRGSYRRLER